MYRFLYCSHWRITLVIHFLNILFYLSHLAFVKIVISFSPIVLIGPMNETSAPLTTHNALTHTSTLLSLQLHWVQLNLKQFKIQFNDTADPLPPKPPLMGLAGKWRYRKNSDIRSHLRPRKTLIGTWQRVVVLGGVCEHGSGIAGSTVYWKWLIFRIFGNVTSPPSGASPIKPIKSLLRGGNWNPSTSSTPSNPNKQGEYSPKSSLSTSRGINSRSDEWLEGKMLSVINEKTN